MMKGRFFNQRKCQRTGITRDYGDSQDFWMIRIEFMDLKVWRGTKLNKKRPLLAVFSFRDTFHFVFLETFPVSLSARYKQKPLLRSLFAQ